MISSSFRNDCIFNRIIRTLGHSGNRYKFKSNSECYVIIQFSTFYAGKQYIDPLTLTLNTKKVLMTM